MNINYNEMKTVKEWAELAGLQLVDYAGFVDKYLKVSKREPSNIIERSNIFTDYAGDLLCNRYGFERFVPYCKMILPEKEQLVKMAEIIPNFAENTISTSLHVSSCKVRDSLDNSKLSLKDDIETLLKDTKYKALIMIKNINFNEKQLLSNFSTANLLNKEDKLLITKFNAMNNFNGTIEDFEIYLINDIINGLESVLKKNNSENLKDILDKENLLYIVRFSSERWLQSTNNENLSIGYVSFDEEEKNRRM